MSENTFPQWFYFGMLQSMGWPRTIGLRRRKVVNAQVADLLADQMGEVARTIAAADRDLGARLLADNMRRDWREDTAGTVGYLTRGHNAGNWGDRLTKIAKEVPWAVLNSTEYHSLIAILWISELWFGLSHPDAIKQALDRKLAGGKERARDAARHGLHVDPERIAESAAEAAAEGISAVRAFEEELGSPIPPPPPALLDLVARYQVSD